jgi:hypothetical protein
MEGFRNIEKINKKYGANKSRYVMIEDEIGSKYEVCLRYE